MQLFAGFTEKARFEQFYNDLTNSVLFDTPVRFTIKYPQVSNYSEIINSKRGLEQLLKEFVTSPNSTEEDINNFLLSHSQSVNTDILKALRKIFRLKLHQIRRQMAEKLIAMEGNLLINFNWRVNMVVSHSLHILCRRPLCSLELIIRIKSEADERRITLELDKDELTAFLGVLRRMQSSLK